MRCLLILAPAVALVPSQRAARRPSALNTATATPPVALEVGAQALDWPNIGFEFRETRSFVRYQFRNGAWDEGAEYPGGLDATVPVSVGATALHYGQSLFEGLKAFACKDGSVRLFRPDRNAARMANGAARTLMAAPDRAGTKRRGAFEMHCAVFGADRGTAAGARRGYFEGTRTRGRRSTKIDGRRRSRGRAHWIVRARSKRNSVGRACS